MDITQIIPSNSPVRSVVSLTVLGALVACSPPADDGDKDPPPPEVQCTDPVDVDCQDESILALGMVEDVAPGGIEDTVNGDWHDVEVDSRAGGAFTTTDGYVYGKFTDEGLVKVDIADFDAFTSMDWDIAFRRYVVRLNSGTGGPSCVSAANLGDNDAFADVTEVAEDATFNKEEYMDDNCGLIPDGSGLENSPGVTLGGYWTYPGCVAMSENIYAVRLADGRTLKLEVLRFYSPQGAQDDCNVGDGLPANFESGRIALRWAFL